MWSSVGRECQKRFSHQSGCPFGPISNAYNYSGEYRVVVIKFEAALVMATEELCSCGCLMLKPNSMDMGSSLLPMGPPSVHYFV